MFMMMLVLMTAAALQDAEAAADAAKCVMAAYNQHDAAAERTCFVRDAVVVRRGVRQPFDWDSEDGYRHFDALTHARFRYRVERVTDKSVEITFSEDNDFLRALGVEHVTARWRYVVRDALIEEAHHLSEPLPVLASTLRQFNDWLRSLPRSETNLVLDANGSILFDGGSAARLVELARTWRLAQ